MLTDRYGGLRRMADQTNRHISRWYIEEWGPKTNIVAVGIPERASYIEIANEIFKDIVLSCFVTFQQNIKCSTSQVFL